MAEELVKKKRVRGGHRRSLKKSLQQVETIIADKTDNSKLPVLKITLKEKLEKLSTLDEEIADLMDDDDTMAEDVEEADEYKQKIHAAINSIDGALVPPGVDKFRSYLYRTAGLTLTEANYKEAVEILQKRFGCKQRIISKHMDISNL